METDFWLPDSIAARARAWLENGGREEIERAFTDADEAGAVFRAAAAVDWRYLNVPMTI